MKKRNFKSTIYTSLVGFTIGCVITSGYSFAKDMIRSQIEDTLNKDLKGLFKSYGKIVIEDNDELDEYLDSKTFEDVYEVLERNSSLGLEDKQKIEKVIEKLEEKTPHIDLRCFYENVKALEIERITEEEMQKRRSNPNTAGYFSPNEKKICLASASDRVFNHEVLHMLNNLNITIDNEELGKRFSYFLDDTGRSMSEGFTEWLNYYLFDYEENVSYEEQVADINIVKYILDLSDKEFAEKFTDYNYEKLVEKMTKYIGKEDAKKLIEICDNERDYLFNQKQENEVLEAELRKKYDILTEACIVSKKGKLTGNDTFQIQRLLSESYKYYIDTSHYYKKEDKMHPINLYLEEKTTETLLQYSSEADNKIQLIMNDKPLYYYDINNLYLGYNKYGTGMFRYRICEIFTDIDGKRKQHYTNDYIFDYESFDSKYTLVPITKLVGDEKETSTIIIEELIKDYQEPPLEESGKTYQYKR